MAAGGSDSRAVVSNGLAEERTGHPCYLSQSEYLDGDKPQTVPKVDRRWLEPGYKDPEVENCIHSINRPKTELQKEEFRIKEEALKSFYGGDFETAYQLIGQIRKKSYKSCGLAQFLMRVECEIEMGIDGPAYEDLYAFVKRHPLHREKIKMLEDTLLSTRRVVGLFVLRHVMFRKRCTDIYQESVDEEELFKYVYESSHRLSEMYRLVRDGRKLNETVFTMIEETRDEVLNCHFQKEAVKDLTLKYCSWCFKFSSGSIPIPESDDDSSVEETE